MEVHGINSNIAVQRIPVRIPGIAEASEQEKSAMEKTDILEEAKKTRENLELRARQVLKPKELSHEERMQQVISADDMKRLMYMYAFAGRGPRTEDPSPLEPAGTTLDLRS
jgi:hypothetical protein